MNLAKFPWEYSLAETNRQKCGTCTRPQSLPAVRQVQSTSDGMVKDGYGHATGLSRNSGCSGLGSFRQTLEVQKGIRN